MIRRPRVSGPTVFRFAPPILLGIFLRLFGSSSQIPLDDEWHSLNFVLDKSLWAVLTTHGLGANCIPQNFVNWILLRTVGWSEATLFLPSILCGIAGLLVFPGLVSRLAGRTVAGLFSWLLAISPCLVFYSRIIRPYSMVLFFGFLSLLCLALWVREGHRRHLATYAISGFAAIYCHLYAALPVLAPLGALLILVLLRRKDDLDAPWISAKALFEVGLLMASLLAIFLGPAHWENPWWLHVLARDRVTAQGLWDFLSLLAGTDFVLGKLVFVVLIGYGLAAWLKKEFRVGLLWVSVWAVFFLLLIFATQDGMHAAIQIARYDIVLFPAGMLLAAFALESLFVRRSPAVRFAAGLLLIGGLAAGSPLWRTFALPNNFMHHSAFQDSYAPFDWSQSRRRALTPMPQMPQERIPAFYSGLAADPAVPGIIEYPMYIGDPLNLHFFYQHVHRKPVAIGYAPDFPFPPLPSRNDFVYQTTPVDYVLRRARELGWEDRMRFRNLVPITDLCRLGQAHRGWLLVVHQDILQETLGLRMNGGNVVPSALLPPLLAIRLGEPVFSDRWISVWRIR